MSEEADVSVEPRYPVWHAKGAKACNRVALLLKRQIEPITPSEAIIGGMKASDVEWPDGHKAERYQLVECNACRTQFGAIEISGGRYIGVELESKMQ